MNVTIKAAGDWELDVLGVPFGGPAGGKDSDGEYFSPETKTYAVEFPNPLAVYYHGYSPEGRPMGEPAIIGRVERITQDARGWWYRVVLDRANEYAKRIWAAAQRGLARASSGSIAHLVRKAQDGQILNWPVVELSLIDAEGKRQPANQYAVAMPAAKAVYERAGVVLPELSGSEDDLEAEPEGGASDATQSGKAETSGTGNQPTNEQPGMAAKHKETEMDETQISQMIADGVKAALDAQAAEAARAAETARVAAMEAELKALKEAAVAERRLPGGTGAPVVAKFANLWQYDNLEPADHALMVGILGAAKLTGHSRRGASEDALKALAVKLVEAKNDDGRHNDAIGAMKMSGMPLKANELNQSTLTSYGDEWVGVTYSRELWDKIRLGTPVIGNIPTVEVPQGSESITIPLDGAAPSFYKVAQASAQAANPGAITRTVTTSKKATSSTSLTVSKLGASVYWTGELEEDSLIPWVSELRRDLQAEAGEVLEHVVIDGDTETANVTNINDIAGQPAGTEPFMLFNGFRKSCLVTTTANSRNGGGAFLVTDFLETLKLMGLAGKNAIDKSKVAFILDLWTAWKALTLPEVHTRDVFAQPTIENGQLTSIYGYPVVPTGNIHRANQDATYGLKANIAGKLDLDTGSNNIRGAILAVRYDQWRLGWKRRVTLETKREPSADATELVMLMRVGLTQRDTEASAITYNVGV